MSATKPERARTAGLVIAEEIAARERELLDAIAEAKKRRSTAERFATAANRADAQVRTLRDQLRLRIKMLVQLVQAHEIREETAAGWLQIERAKHDLPENPPNGLRALSIDQALPYATGLLKERPDDVAIQVKS